MQQLTKPVSLSTMWGVGRFERFSTFYEKARDLGFQYVELNYQVDSAFLAEALSISGLPVSSVHNPVPHTQLSENRWAHELSFSSLDEDERQAAIVYAKPSIDLAARVGPCPLVVHVGGSGLDPALSGKLSEMFNAGQRGTPEYEEFRTSLERERKALAGRPMEQAIRSITELSEYAADKGVILALESRYHFHEIPNLEEMKILVEVGNPGTVGYWHDVGHCENLERLGFVKHEEWLRQLGSRIVGTHLHDMIGLADHKAVGKGDLDHSMVGRYLPEKAVRVCEYANWNPEEDIATGLILLRERRVI